MRLLTSTSYSWALCSTSLWAWEINCARSHRVMRNVQASCAKHARFSRSPSLPAYGVQSVRQTLHEVQPHCMGWCSPPPPPPHHLSQLDKIQGQALALFGPGVVVDSLALRRSLAASASWSSTNWCVDRVFVACRHDRLLCQHMTHFKGPDSKSGSQMATAFSLLKVAWNEVKSASFAQRSAHRDSRIWRPESIEPAAERIRRARRRRRTFKSAYSDP